MLLPGKFCPFHASYILSKIEWDDMTDFDFMDEAGNLFMFIHLRSMSEATITKIRMPSPM